MVSIDDEVSCEPLRYPFSIEKVAFFLLCLRCIPGVEHREKKIEEAIVAVKGSRGFVLVRAVVMVSAADYQVQKFEAER